VILYTSQKLQDIRSGVIMLPISGRKYRKCEK